MCINNSPAQIAGIISNLKKEQLNIVKWEPSNPYYPEYMFLGTDRGILAYVDFFTHVDQNDLSCELDDIVEKTRLATSDLDRPIFYIHLANNLSSFFCFETDEQVKDRIFTGDNCLLRAFEDSYYVDIDQTGSFDELISIFKRLKKAERV